MKCVTGIYVCVECLQKGDQKSRKLSGYQLVDFECIFVSPGTRHSRSIVDQGTSGFFFTKILKIDFDL